VGRIREEARLHQTSPKWPLLLGPGIYLVVWLWLLATGARLDFSRANMLQFVGPEELRASSWSELLLIHAQPPGFNALLKLTDEFGSESTLALAVIFAVCTIAGLWMTGDVVLQLTGSIRWAAAAGVLAAIVPGTAFYSLWVFYTTPTAFLLTATVWAMIRGSRTHSVWLIAISTASLTLAALTRSSIVWPLIPVWILANRKAVLAAFRVSSRWTSTVAGTLMVLSVVGLGFVQGHAFSTFGSPTLSSWGFENSSKALLTTMNEQEIASVVGDDECLGEVLATGVFRPIVEYPDCARSGGTHSAPDSALLDAEFWQNGAPNMNHRDRLALSESWRDFTVSAVADDPTRVIRIPFPSLANQERGTVVRFLWPSAWYWLIEQNVSRGGLVSTLWIAAFSWVPIFMIGLVVVGLVRSRTLWGSDRTGRSSFRISSVAVLALTVLYLFLETGENERFRVEIDWLLISLGISVLATVRSKVEIRIQTESYAKRVNGRRQAQIHPVRRPGA